MRLTDEVRVGMIASLGLLLLVLTMVFLRGYAVGRKGMQKDVIFGEVGGLREGAEVHLAGVVVGSVEEVGLTKDHRARVRMWLKPEVILPRDAVFTVGRSGLLGEPYLQIDVEEPESARLTREDLKDPVGLAAELRRGSAPLSRYLCDRLSVTAKQVLDRQARSGATSPALEQALVRELNRLMEREHLFSPDRFEKVPLTKEIARLLQENPRGERLVLANRLLLGRAYPRLLRSLPRSLVAEVPKGTFRGEDPVTLEDLVPRLGDLMEDVQGIAEDTRGLLSDPVLTESLRQTATNVAVLTANLNKLVANPRLSRGLYGSLENAEKVTREAALVAVDVRKVTQDLSAVNRILANVEGITADGRAQVQELLEQTKSIMTDLSDTTDAIRWVAKDSGILKEQLPALVESGKKSVANVEKITANLEALTGDADLRADLKESLASLKETLDNVKQATAGLRDLAADPQLHTDLRETITSAKTTMAHAENVSEKVDNVLGTTGDTLTKLGRFKWDTELTYRYLPSNNRVFGDLGFLIWPSSKNYFKLGIHDFAEESKIELQAGSFLSDYTRLRIGLVRAKVGVGLEYQIGPRYSFSADLYDPNDLSLNLWGHYQLNDKWSLLLGVDDFGHQSLGGLGVRFAP
jgi:ABC-type transporter Mla subunit MlaD